MKKNMGGLDRTVRFVVAAIIAVLYFTGTISGIFAYVLLVLGVIFVLTSFISFCPLYTLFGINSCRIKNR
ncbi:YgaP family membrane protein [Flagellimonas sp. S174]|uniref:YgaP family membrane protein n=1 Tax=Flagellimonas sp. S174 TaxID=3410790 RepID=UPI003BF5FFF6